MPRSLWHNKSEFFHVLGLLKDTFISIFLKLARIAGEPMYDWEDHHGCSYLHLGSDFDHALTWAAANTRCANAGASAASITNVVEWRGVEHVMSMCKLTIHAYLQLL